MSKKIEDKDRRVSMSISLSEKERKKLKEAADKKGLSLSAFLRLAALENMKNKGEK